MKIVYNFLVILIAAAACAQETIPSQLSLAVKESQGWNTFSFSQPDFSYYNKNYDSVFRNYEYTFNMQDRGQNKIYVDGDKFYSNTYIPPVLQIQQPHLAINNYCYTPQTATEPAVVNAPIVRQ